MRAIAQTLSVVFLLANASCYSSSSATNGDASIPDTDDMEDAGPDAAVPLSCGDNGRCDQKFCEQVPIPAGTFEMGADENTYEEPDLVPVFEYGDETPVHEVSLDAYCIDKHEVTYERYLACVDDGPCLPDGHEWKFDDPPPPGHGVVVNHYPEECEAQTNLDGIIERCPHLAVNCKTRAQAASYCEWIGRRLCTEAEWERAASGPPPERRTYPWGDEEPDGHANLPGVVDYVAPVDDFASGASAEGVMNLTGNVFEWVSDDYAPYDSSGEPGDLAIARGGCAFEGHHAINTARALHEPSFDWG